MTYTCYTRHIIGYLNGLRLVNFIETAATVPVKILYSNPARAGHASSYTSVTYIIIYWRESHNINEQY